MLARLRAVMVAAAKQMMMSEVGENNGPIIAVSGPKSLNFKILGRRRGPCVVSNAVKRYKLSPLS